MIGFRTLCWAVLGRCQRTDRRSLSHLSECTLTYQSGRHFLQLPGPTNTPARVLQAMAKATIDHRGPEFADLTARLLEGLRYLFKTKHDVFMYPASGSGAWEAAIANTLSPGDRVLLFEQGFFAQTWAKVASRFGIDVVNVEWNPRIGVRPEAVIRQLEQDATIKAVCIVHNETSTGVTTDIESIGRAMRDSGHPAMLFVDAVSSLAVTDLQHDAWSIDVTVSGSQKGMMLPPGLAVLAVGPRAMEAHEGAMLPRSYWDWDDQKRFNERGFFPYTPATNLMFGLEEALAMLAEEGLENVFARHALFGRVTRAAVEGWGLDVVSQNESEASQAATAVLVPKGHDADAVRALILDRFDMSLGTGLDPFRGQVFRVGHIGDLGPLQLIGTLAGVEMGLQLSGVISKAEGVDAAMEALIKDTAI